MTKIILFLVVLVGCGSKVPGANGYLIPGDTTCIAEGITVHFEFKADCAKSAKNVALAHKMAIEIGLVMPDGTVGRDFIGVYKDTQITVKAAEDLGCYTKENEKCVTLLWGDYGYGNTIRTRCESNILLHEMAHRIEQLSFDRCTNHESWDKWGWTKADLDYRALTEDTCYID